MIGWNPPGQVHRLTPKFVLPGMPSHHGTTHLPDPNPLGYSYLFALHLGNWPFGFAFFTADFLAPLFPLPMSALAAWGW
jgi:hypothetical protein